MPDRFPQWMFGAVLAAASCSGDPITPMFDAGPDAHSTCETGFLGDESKEPELFLTVLGPDERAHEIGDGAPVAIIEPPQGGRVIFIGARARNIDGCGVQLSGAITDPETKQVRLDSRTINLRPSSDGWGTSTDSDISTFANVPVCHNQWTDSDVYGNEFELSLAVRDKADRRVEKTVRAVPFCAEPSNEAECTCICKGGYVLGEPCGEDGTK